MRSVPSASASVAVLTLSGEPRCPPGPASHHACARWFAA